MKTGLIVLVLLVAGIAKGQSGPPQSGPPQDSMRSGVDKAFLEQYTPLIKRQEPEEVLGKHVKYSGMLVRLFKTDHPAQLFNPAAPPQYNVGTANVVPDPTGRHAACFNLFSFRF